MLALLLTGLHDNIALGQTLKQIDGDAQPLVGLRVICIATSNYNGRS